MLNLIIIFGAKYLLIIPIIISGIYFLKLDNTKKKKILLLGSIILPLTYIIALISSHFYYDARPFVTDNITPLIPHGADNGFPSDHILLLSAIAVLFYPFSKKLSFTLWVFTLLVAVSRVYAGVHHFIDVIGSAIISIIVLFLVSQMITFVSKVTNK
jgi:undecaprenyl-diphosphatase